MTSPRNLLLIALLFISYLLWMQWQEDYHAPHAQPAAQTTLAAADIDAASPSVDVGSADVPSAATNAAAAAPAEPVAGALPSSTVAHVVVTTDLLRVETVELGARAIHAHGDFAIAATIRRMHVAHRRLARKQLDQRVRKLLQVRG